MRGISAAGQRCGGIIIVVVISQEENYFITTVYGRSGFGVSSTRWSDRPFRATRAFENPNPKCQSRTRLKDGCHKKKPIE
eukprot:scaffold4157_cov136-Cylindrotheca_fusiformis.AAC.13